MSNNIKTKGVFVIYTGGTIGSKPRNPNDLESPMKVVEWDEFIAGTPELDPSNIGFKIDSYSTAPLDSCNIGPKEWVEMANCIKERHEDYEGFVILHGTDTMVYTASALSFMLRNLKKPVILTGAQVPSLCNVRNDALQNIVTAVQIANPKHTRIPVIPEVCIYFHGKLLRGNRSRKLHASGFDAYQSPDYSSLAIAGESIQVDKRMLFTPMEGESFTTRTRLEKNVALIHFFPGIQDGDIIKKILSQKDLKGVVLSAYGAGNIPTKPNTILKLIKDATNRGVVALDVTQCGGGKVELGMYETSAKLLDANVVSGVDITPEAALCKLMVLLGDPDMSKHEIALMAQRNIAGEQSLSIYTTEFTSDTALNVKMNSECQRVRIPAKTIERKWSHPNEIDRVMLRFRNGKIKFKDQIQAKDQKQMTDHLTLVRIKLYINLSEDDELDDKSSNYLGTFEKIPNHEETILFFNITEKAKTILGERASFTVYLSSEDCTFSWESVELVVFLKENYRKR